MASELTDHTTCRRCGKPNRALRIVAINGIATPVCRSCERTIKAEQKELHRQYAAQEAYEQWCEDGWAQQVYS